ncbi:MAG: holC [Gammaproteobacteria bacterium]|jgi:DNA polymerase-3 subunit chi|nr:holC [Gammaproteobacteria bacterium]
MPKIDFYLIPDQSEKERLLFACRFIEKVYKEQQRVYIHTETQTLAHQLDELLWTYREDSFLPHDIRHKERLPTSPIQIGFNATPEEQWDVLINLSTNVPEFYPQFMRVVELVSEDPIVQTAARERYKLYRMQGHTINTYKTSIET